MQTAQPVAHCGWTWMKIWSGIVIWGGQARWYPVTGASPLVTLQVHHRTGEHQPGGVIFSGTATSHLSAFMPSCPQSLPPTASEHIFIVLIKGNWFEDFKREIWIYPRGFQNQGEESLHQEASEWPSSFQVPSFIRGMSTCGSWVVRVEGGGGNGSEEAQTCQSIFVLWGEEGREKRRKEEGKKKHRGSCLYSSPRWIPLDSVCHSECACMQLQT